MINIYRVVKNLSEKNNNKFPNDLFSILLNRKIQKHANAIFCEKKIDLSFIVNA